MLYGNVVGDSIGTDHSLVPMLTPPGIKEYEFKAKFGKKHTLWGFADFYCPDTRVLHENKTSTNPNQWTQKKVDDHTQLTMYALMLFLKHKIKPEDVKMVLNFIPVLPTYTMPDPVVVHSFETSRTTKDVLEYSAFILDTLVEMERYVNGMRELR